MHKNDFPIVTTNTSKDVEQAIKAASTLISQNGVVLFPTDTTYALGVNALNELAIDKVYDLKLRPPQKPIHIIVPSLDMAEEYVYLNDTAYRLAEKFLPGALTLVLKHKNNIPENLVAGYSTLGIRIPNNRISLDLARRTGVPITATSANISGKTEVYSVEDFIVQMNSFNPSGKIDLMIDQGSLPVVSPSTIIDLTSETVKIIREGPISLAEIQEYLYGNLGAS